MKEGKKQRKKEKKIAKGKIFVVPVQDQIDMRNESHNHVDGLHCLSDLTSLAPMMGNCFLITLIKASDDMCCEMAIYK